MVDPTSTISDCLKTSKNLIGNDGPSKEISIISRNPFSYRTEKLRQSIVGDSEQLIKLGATALHLTSSTTTVNLSPMNLCLWNCWPALWVCKVLWDASVSEAFAEQNSTATCLLHQELSNQPPFFLYSNLATSETVMDCTATLVKTAVLEILERNLHLHHLSHHLS